MTTQLNTGIGNQAPTGETPPPRWARITAHLAVLVTLPAGLWRIAMGIGIPVGYSDEVLRSVYDVPGAGTFANIGISVCQECVALLTLGLVSRWGEVVPRWIPFLGGKRVHPLAGTIPAALGAAALTVIALSQLLLWDSVTDSALQGTGRTVMGWCYLPLILWGPLLGLVTISYYRRRRGALG
ncbi:hypothetical protein [Streptomyces sp. TP-A0874]|uniref:hypothetical protein n=1 Tax=Streptomyces sp. TP-A0874 TaxID=549819 RepID=UPI0008538913|nr:hypothetical protein [Streptomyces sp. TP-A0874]